MYRYLALVVGAAVLAGGCAPAPSKLGPDARALTAEQAGALAQRLANEKAQALFHCQPFHNSPPAQFVRGHWTWHDLRGRGSGDFEATVEFATDGVNPDVSVIQLDNHVMLR